MRNSDLNLLDASCSAGPPLEHIKLSISSKNNIAGSFKRAMLNSVLTSFSLSPLHLLVKVEHAQLKKVSLFAVSPVLVAEFATARASMVFPFPGGPYSKTPFPGFRIPVNISGIRRGRINAS